jgi:hypothetical protein
VGEHPNDRPSIRRLFLKAQVNLQAPSLADLHRY